MSGRYMKTEALGMFPCSALFFLAAVTLKEEKGSELYGVSSGLPVKIFKKKSCCYGNTCMNFM